MKKKLGIKKATIRDLDEQALGNVAGGTGTNDCSLGCGNTAHDCGLYNDTDFNYSCICTNFCSGPSPTACTAFCSLGETDCATQCNC